MPIPERYDAYLRACRDRHLAELCDFLRIPSVSALPECAGDVRRAAEWVAQAMRAVGLQGVEVLPTGGHPVVYGEWLEAPGRPTLLVYGHYDVQPADPLDLWTSPPFDPQVRDGRLYARGATDDKGQIFLHLKAMEALRAVDGRLPLNLKVLVEGEEEGASANLEAFVARERERLGADAAVISDSPMYDERTPSIGESLRGIAALELHVRTGRSDLHSGLFGGVAPNALHVLADLLAGLHTADGRVAVAGFYDAVRPLSPTERQAFAALPQDDEALREQIGATRLCGEPGFTVPERLWRRPTLEVNGAWGGFLGSGQKTIIPCEAHAKITCRLVPDQDPEAVSVLVERHLLATCPPTATLRVDRLGGGRPSLTPRDQPAMRAAARAMAAAYGREPVPIGMGGSIPVAAMLQERLGLPVVLLGFGLPAENLHAPDEHFHLANFDRGIRTLCLFYVGLAS